MPRAARWPSKSTRATRAIPTTLKDQIEKVRTRFGLSRVVFVGDRGMLTSARIREELAPVEGLDWVSALRAEQIRKLAEDGGPLQPTLFDQTDLAEIRIRTSRASA